MHNTKPKRCKRLIPLPIVLVLDNARIVSMVLTIGKLIYYNKVVNEPFYLCFRLKNSRSLDVIYAPLSARCMADLNQRPFPKNVL